MIQTKHELIQLLNPIYNHFQLPIFLLSKELLIIESPHSFLRRALFSGYDSRKSY